MRAPAQDAVGELTERLGGETLQGRGSGGERDERGVGGGADDRAQRRVECSLGTDGQFAAPGERGPGGFGAGGGADEGSPADVATNQSTRFELAVGADGGRPADAEGDCEIAFRGKAVTGAQVAPDDRLCQLVAQLPVEHRPGTPIECQHSQIHRSIVTRRGGLANDQSHIGHL